MGTNDNFNLMGNPFTAYINSATLAANNAVINNATFWIWDGSQYATYNIPSPIDIAPGQGFFIEANATDAITFSTANQSHQSTDTFMRPATTNNFEIAVTNGKNTSSSKVFYVDGTTTGFDSGYDSKMFGGTTYNFAVYTDQVTNSTGEKLAIQTLPTDNKEAITIPVGIIAKAGETITFSINSNMDTSIYLENVNTGDKINLSETDYTVTLNEDKNGTGDFYMSLSNKSLSTEEVALSNVSIYQSSENQVTITGIQQESKVSIYTVSGAQVYNGFTNSNDVNTINLPNLSTGVYIIKLSSDNGSKTQKIILN